MSAGSAWRGRHAIVTGGSSGIGLAMVCRLSELGAKVSVVALDDGYMEALRDAPPGDQLHTVGVDLADRASAQAAFASCAERHGECDLLVTCAGIVSPGYFTGLGDEVLEREMRVNYFGTLWAVRSVVPSMMRRRSGSVVMISSFAAMLGVFGMGAYGPPKWAIRGLFETLRTEMRPHGVHVMCVFPTDVDTPMLEREIPLHPPEQDAMQGKIKPMPPSVVVDAILDGLERRKARVFPGRLNASRAWLLSAAPGLTSRFLDLSVAKAAKKKNQNAGRSAAPR